MRQHTLIATAMLAMGLFAIAPAIGAMHHHEPMVHTQGQVNYITGGIGADERKAMRHTEGKYSLTMEFSKHAKARNAYFGEADVRIKDSKGKTVLNVQTDGPMLAANLPPGTYTVWARAEGVGKAQSQKVTIAPNSTRHIGFAWH